jgi:hypothetical protein
MSPEKQKLITILATVVDKLHGEKGEQGEQGNPGVNGVDGRDGVDGKNGINGKDGKDGKTGAKGEKGDTGTTGKDGENGKNGKDGVDGKDGKDGEVTPGIILEVASPLITQNVQRAISSKTYSATEIVGLAEFVAENSGSSTATFETVSKNLDTSNAVLNYTGENLTSIAYVNGITKTLNYTGENLTSVVLSGSTPSGIDLTKTLSYTGDNLTGVTYS